MSRRESLSDFFIKYNINIICVYNDYGNWLFFSFLNLFFVPIRITLLFSYQESSFFVSIEIRNQFYNKLNIICYLNSYMNLNLLMS